MKRIPGAKSLQYIGILLECLELADTTLNSRALLEFQARHALENLSEIDTIHQFLSEIGVKMPDETLNYCLRVFKERVESARRECDNTVLQVEEHWQRGNGLLGFIF